jgi:hypothetical protein
MARPLQHRQAAQRIALPPASAGEHRPDGPEAHDALTIKPDHPMGARQRREAKEQTKVADWQSHYTTARS